jgi:hypothetical protein
MEIISRGVWEGAGEGTFIGEFGTSCDRPVPFRVPSGEVCSRVSGFNKFSVDTNVIVSEEEIGRHDIGHTYSSVPVCLRPCSLGFSPFQH